MKVSLQILGALALFTWTSLGVYGWSLVGDGVQLTVMEGGNEAAPRNVALLGDRLDTLDRDIDALVASLTENFGLLASSVEKGLTTTQIARAVTEQRLRALESALPAALHAREAAGALASVLSRLESLASGSTRQELPGSSPHAESSEVDSGEPAPPTEPPSSSEDPVLDRDDVPLASETETMKRSFLAFTLPSRDFRFEGAQTFEVLEDLSRVGFDARSTLHDFTGVSNHVNGQFTVDLARPEDGIHGSLEILSASLSTDLEGRDEAMWEHLDNDHFERIRFVPTALEAEQIDADAMRISGTLTGQMSIHGVTRTIHVQVAAHVDEGRRLVVEGETPLDIGDYGVSIPSKLGLISVDETVRIWIHLRLRAGAKGSPR